MAKLTTCTAEMRDRGTVLYRLHDLEDIVPHRRSALLADSIFRCDENLFGTWMPEKCRFEGHFDSEPVLPAHYLMESGAILGLCAATFFFGKEDKQLKVLASKMSIEAKKTVAPGKEVFFSFEDFGEPRHIRSMIIFTGKVTAWVDGVLVAIIEVTGSVTFS
jgi:3-hydroxymyristoyl/3-hydroxydecanoyl-(acyl carrier protein) dehydratase